MASTASFGNRSLTPSCYARQLLASLGAPTPPANELRDVRAPAQLWADSGAMWLSGHADGSARPCPAPLASCAQGAWLALAALSKGDLDTAFPAYQLLGERAAIAGLVRRGRQSPGGACRLVATADGAIALNLAREADVELLPAWLEMAVGDPSELDSILAGRILAPLIARARLLGLAAAPMRAPRQRRGGWQRTLRIASPHRPPASAAPPLVVDLSALWAGPLCGQLLAASGARVIKVESSARPDGARAGPAAFFDLMNAAKESVVLDFRQPAERARLQALLARADIVIEAARPRGLEQLGIDAAALVAARPGKVWLSITGYGRRAPARDWIAYGDDAGVCAGLSWLMGGDRGDPVFCGDAIADPLTGLHAALLAYTRWRQGGGVLLDVALQRVVSYCISAGMAELDPTASPQPPVARAPTASAVAFGADTDRVLREFT